MDARSAIHVVDAGKGPTVLCLHGIGSSSRAFRPQIDGLGDRLRLLAWDAPGYAASGDPTSPLSMDDYADAAAEVIQAHGGGPVHALGASWGGVIAIRLALRHPHLVHSLILAASTRGPGRAAGQATVMRGRAEELHRRGGEAFARARAPRLVSANAGSHLAEQAVEMMSSAIRLPGYRYATEAMAATNVETELSDIDVPTMVVCGNEDVVTGPPESWALAQGITDATLITVPGAGHLVNQEQPTTFNVWLDAFIRVVENQQGRSRQ